MWSDSLHIGIASIIVISLAISTLLFHVYEAFARWVLTPKWWVRSATVSLLPYQDEEVSILHSMCLMNKITPVLHGIVEPWFLNKVDFVVVRCFHICVRERVDTRQPSHYLIYRFHFFIQSNMRFTMRTHQVHMGIFLPSYRVYSWFVPGKRA